MLNQTDDDRVLADFWLATFEVRELASDPALGPIAGANTRDLAIEVLRNGDEWAVLFSAVEPGAAPTELKCLIGFGNGAKACNVWSERGFPLVDAVISCDDKGLLIVKCPFFGPGDPSMHYDVPLFSISGIQLRASPGIGGPKTVATAVPTKNPVPSYRQEMRAPDSAQPDRLISRKEVMWSPSRFDVQSISNDPGVHLDLHDRPRNPSLAPLETGHILPKAAWSGLVDLPSPKDRKLGNTLDPMETVHTLGVPAFRFEDVEILGFRIDLREFARPFAQDLARLVAPLNFHLEHGGPGRRRAIADFRYRAATPTLVIELLRYGRMKSRAPSPPLEADDHQSQHELLVRILVGRVDDDTAQAHAPAVYVPAVFVDNPWSKMLGRTMIGFDKRMADFCVNQGNDVVALQPDGRINPKDQNAVPLGAISQLRLVDRAGVAHSDPFLEFEFASSNHTDPDALRPIDLDLVAGTSTVANTRWRQTDFDDAEFRRSFASVAVADSVRAFRSIQVSPFRDQKEFDRTWITGTFLVDPDVRADLPQGLATLTLRAIPQDPARRTAPSCHNAWNLLSEMLGDGKEARITLPRGSWYRMHCSMDLTIDDGLDWSAPSIHRRPPTTER